jgi:hypothetical protein
MSNRRTEIIIIRPIRQRIMRWAGRVAHNGDTKNACMILVVKRETSRQLVRLRVGERIILKLNRM